ncbi:MAG: hypothetical protein HY713_10480 [candidate division NC10 bacterium]|nr:hypothetical protein [candidate division NC10 bacterium]
MPAGAPGAPAGILGATPGPRPTTAFLTHIPRAGDDSSEVRVVRLAQVPFLLAFNHESILTDYVVLRRRRSR